MGNYVSARLTNSIPMVVCQLLPTPNKPKHTFQKFLQAAPHYVDVFDANELKTDVVIVVNILIALPSCPIGHGIQLQRSKK